jgi:outer membrane protein assembly factor BamB
MVLLKQNLKCLGLTLMLGLSLAACSSNKDPEPVPIEPFQSATGKIKVDWEVSSLSVSSAGSFVPVIDDSVVFTSDSGGNVFRIDPTDGTVINRFNLHRKLSSGIAASSDSVFVTTMDGYLLSVSKVDGKIRWQAKLPTISIEAPQIANNIVIVRTNDSELLAYDIGGGGLLWVYQKPVPPLTLRAYNSFQIVGTDVVLLGQPGGRLVLLNLTNGLPIWENYVAIPEGATDLDKLTDIAMRPVISDKEVCVASFNGKIACLDAIASTLIWAKNFSSSSGIVVSGSNLYTTNQDGVVYAFDKETGAVIWQNKDLQYHNLSMPALLNNSLVIIDDKGYINLFNLTDGKLTARVASDLQGSVAYPLANGSDKVIFQSGNGNIEQLSQD